MLNFCNVSAQICRGLFQIKNPSTVNSVVSRPDKQCGRTPSISSISSASCFDRAAVSFGTMTMAFAGSVPACIVRGKSATITRDSQRSRVRSTSAARRRRVVAVDGQGSPVGDQPKDEESSARTEEDSEASDLALPDLRALFESAGDPNCEQCTGSGITPCPVCDAKGFFSLTMMDTVSSSQCRLCKGKKNIPCPTCRAEVYKSVLWWDLIPSKEEDPEEKWREGPEWEPRFRWNDNPAGPAN